jgi:hypothetical protein
VQLYWAYGGLIVGLFIKRNEKYLLKLKNGIYIFYLKSLNEKKIVMFDFDTNKTKMLLEVTNSILDLPRVSIMCASDELFMLYIAELDEEGRKTIQDFFDVSRKFNFMTDELEKKQEMFIGITKNFGINEKREFKSKYDPNRISKIKKTAKLQNLTKKELILIIKRYGINNYIKSKKQKALDIDYQNIIKKIIKKNSGKYNNFLRVHFNYSPGQRPRL